MDYQSNYKYLFLDDILYEACRSANNELSKIIDELKNEKTYSAMNYLSAMNAIIENRGRFTNTSICHYHDDYYIISSRVIYFDKNSSKHLVDPKKNFWWNDWQNIDINNNNLFFVCHYNTNGKKINTSLLLLYQIHNTEILEHDVQLIKNNGKLFIFVPVQNDAMCNFEIHQNIYIKINNDCIISSLRGNNLSLMDMNYQEKTYSFLNWFHNGYVSYCYSKILDIGLYKIPQNVNKKFIVDNNYGISGKGSYLNQIYDKNDIDMIIDKDHVNYGIMPLFSFGTPNIECIYNDKKYKIGVGHIKIEANKKYEYVKNSNIDIFRNNYIDDFKKYFGDKFILHNAYNSKSKKSQSYIYMMFFYYYLTKEDEITEFKISNSFYPLNIKANNDYIFSVIFPSGITTNNDNIIITAGHGDYNSVLMEFETSFILSECKHNIKNLDLKNYEYEILNFTPGDIYRKPRLADIYENKGGYFFEKYIKYKHKYLNSKKN